MENNLDELFRNKLSDHKVNPSAESWEKLESQIIRARWGRTQKRLAIAASVVLFLSVIGRAYYYLDIQKSVENPMVSENVEPDFRNTEVTETPAEPQVALGEIKEVDDKPIISQEPKVQIAETGPMQNQSESSWSNPETEATNTLSDSNNDLPLLAEADNENPITAETGTDEYQAETTPESVVIEIQPPSEPLTVTITYKANKNSKLVASQKGNVIQEGIEKIAGFAEERVFTDEIKTKLRNTTDDILALNFGKLINKPNKEN